MPTNRLDNARYLRKNLTVAEQRLWFYLRDKRFQHVKFRRQRPIGPYIVDFVSLQYRVVIEVDGSQHALQTEYDIARDAWLEAQGFLVLRFWNQDVMENIDDVMNAIYVALEKGF